MGPVASLVTQALDAMVRRRFHWRDRTFVPFQVCGLAGFAFGGAVAGIAASQRGLPLAWIAGLWICAAVTFLSLAMLVKIVTGRENLVYYHHEIAVLGVSAAILWTAGEPVLPLLDAVVIGLGAFLACGRLGCFHAACCHGRPSDWGVRYGDGYVEDGLDPHLAGVRLLPVQVLESAGSLLIAMIALAVFRRPGSAFVWCTAAYAALRFGLEFLRGDGGRRAWRGLTEAQWTSVIVASAALAPLHWAAMTIPAAALLHALRQEPREAALLHPAHLSEFAAAADRARRSGPGPCVLRTRNGIRVSASDLPRARSISVSREGAPLPFSTARRLCEFAMCTPGPRKWIAGGDGVHHLIVTREQAP